MVRDPVRLRLESLRVSARSCRISLLPRRRLPGTVVKVAFGAHRLIIWSMSCLDVASWNLSRSGDRVEIRLPLQGLFGSRAPARASAGRKRDDQGASAPPIKSFRILVSLLSVPAQPGSRTWRSSHAGAVRPEQLQPLEQDAPCQPCPLAVSTGVLAHPRRLTLAACCSSGAPGPETSRDVDRLLEIAGEARRQEPVAAPRVAARRSARRPVSAPVRSPSASSRATSVPSMSGSRRSIRMTSGRCSVASAIASSPRRRFERPEPGRAQHVPGELQVLLVVVDDQDERRIASATSRTVWRRGVTAVSSARADPARARR